MKSKPSSGGGPSAPTDFKKRREERDAAAAVQIGKDQRFSAAIHDPRFSRGMGRAQRTVAIDDRFAGMFTDADFQVKAAVDKRGRKVAGGQQAKGEDLRRYYRLKDEDSWKPEDTKPPAKTKASTAVPVTNPKQQPAAKKAQKKEQRDAAGAHGSKAGGAQVKGSRKASVLEDEDMLLSEGSEESENSSEMSEDGSDVESSDDSEGSEDGLSDDARKRWARARGIDLDAKDDSDEDGDSSDEGADSDSSYDSADEPLTDEEEDEEAMLQKVVSEWGVGALAANPAEPIPQGDETHRLAVVDQDWEHVRAVDLLAGFNSFLPKGSRIQRVTVYPSDYGLERMAKEAVMGPQGILKPKEFKASKVRKAAATKSVKEESTEEGDSDDEDEDDDEGGDDSMSEEEGSGSEGQEGGGDEEEREVDMARLRLYEQSKLRYYYAVVECDSVATAVALYNECDGMEFEHSACKLDLRFIPDDQKFEGRQVRDSATSVPSDYKPPDVFTASLQHTDPQLTWDAEDVRRKKVLQKKMTEDEIKEADFAAFLASSASEDEDSGVEEAGGARAKEDPQAIRERYRALLLGGGGASKAGGSKKGGKAAAGSDEDDAGDSDAGSSGGSEDGSDDDDEGGEEVRVGGKSWGNEDDEGEDGEGGRANGQAGGKGSKSGRRRDVEMEVTYLPGLEGLGKRLIEKKREAEAQKSESVWEAYLRRRREKKKERKNKKNQDSSDDDSDDEVDAKAAKNDDAFFQADQEDDPFNDPFFNDPSQGVAIDSEDEGAGRGMLAGRKGKAGEAKKGSKTRGKAGEGQQEDKQNAAELELLLMDDDDIRLAALKNAPGAAAALAAKSAKAAPTGDEGKVLKGKKAKRAAKKEAKAAAAAAMRDDDDEDAGGFTANANDPRFKDMFNSHEFALDPTDPRYKAVKDSKLTQELSKRRKERAPQAAAAPKQQQQQQNGAGSQSNNEHDELKGMVAKLKRKGQQQQQQNNKKPAKKPRV